MASRPHRYRYLMYHEILMYGNRRSCSGQSSLYTKANLRLQQTLTPKILAKLLTVLDQAPCQEKRYHLSNLHVSYLNLQAHKEMVWASTSNGRHLFRQQKPTRDPQPQLIRRWITQHLRNRCLRASKKNQKTSLDSGRISHLVTVEIRLCLYR